MVPPLDLLLIAQIKQRFRLMVLSIIFLKTTVQTTKITCILIWLLASISAFGRQKLMKLKIR